MIYFVDNNGTIIKPIESPVYQGSAESNNIILIAPFAANLQFTVAFFLPNGEITPRYAMTQGGTLNGVEYAPTNGAMAIWTFSMPNNITQYFGTVYAQFYAYGTNGQITASSRTSFVVARGVPEELPDSPDPTIYTQILTIISQINTALNNGSYAARAIYWWINTYTYGMNEITFYPIGTYGAFVRSTVTGNTGNQPYTDDGVLNSEHWEELVNFNKIYAAEQNAIAQAQAAAESAQNAEESASAAAQSAQDAADSANSIGQSEQNAAQSAQAAAESAQAAAESASKAEGVLQNAAIKNEPEVIRAPWDFDTQNGPIDFYFENKDSSYVTINGFSVAISDNNGDYIRTTQYQDDRITYQANETTTYTLEFPEKSGTLALTSDVAAEASERESADNALQSDIDGIQQQLSETQHFRGYYETTAQVQSISNPHSGDYAWNAQTGTVWNYSTSWSDSGEAIPDQTVPKSSTTPLMDGTATLGSTNTYADGAHRHPTDTTRASVTALNSETESRTSADNNLQSQIDDIKDGTTVVGSAKNVTSQIDGHAISDIFETDGTTVKEATQAQEAEILTDGFNVGTTTSTAIVGYYKFATIEKLVNYQQANIRLEISDANIANYPQQICGIELRYYNSPSAPSRIDVAVLYGNPAILSYIYVSVSTEGDIDLYFYNSGAYGSITIKPLYQNSRTNQDKFNIFANIADYISTLPAAATNTALPDLEHYEIITEAKKLALAAAVGSSSKPVYFNASGLPVACGDELDVSVTGGAGYLAKNGIVNASATTQVGWWKVFSVPISKLTSLSVASTYSVLVEVNGVYDGDEGSGKIEINGRSNSSLWTEANCRALSGNLNLQNFAVAVSSNGANLEFYTYEERQFTRIAFTVTSEYYSASAVNVITWTLAFSSTTAPSGAVYAVNRNIAANTKRHVIRLRNNVAGANYIVFFTFTDNSDTKYTSVSALANALYNLGYNSEDNAYPVSGQFLSNGSALSLSRRYVVRSGSSGVSDGTHTYYSGTRQFNMVEENESNSPNTVGYVGISEGTITNVEVVTQPITGNYAAGVTSDGKGISVAISRVTSPNTDYSVLCTITYTLPILGNNVFAIYGTNNGFLHVLVQSDRENVLYEDISISPSIITDI